MYYAKRPIVPALQSMIMVLLLQSYGFKLKKSKGAEIRVLIVFCYNMALGLCAQTYFSRASKMIPELFDELEEYFDCESVGTNGSTCDRSGFERLTDPELATMGYFLVGVYPVVNLVYVIHIGDLRKWVLKQ